MSTEKRAARRKRQRERRKQAAERLGRRLEERQHEKEVADWLLHAADSESTPALIEEALAQAAGTPLEQLTAELVQLVGAGSEGEDIDQTLERVSGWLDTCEARFANQEASHADDP